METQTQRGFGLAGQTPPETIRQAGLAVEHAGYDSFWLSNPPGQNALQPLASVAAETQRLMVGVGVIPLSHHSSEEIAGRVDASGIPLERLYLGIGSGSGNDPLERVRLGLQAIRAEVEVTLFVAALGPKMTRLAAEGADGVLLNWLTPQHARRSMRWVREGAEQAGRPAPPVFAYVRVALGEASIARLQREAASYSAIPHYARHFQRMGVTAMDTTIAGHTADEVQQGLAAWDGVVDAVVVRAIAADDTPEAVQAIVQAASPH